MSEAVLAIEQATKRYGGRTVLEISRFELSVGDRLQVMGSNGAGKSTFLRIVAGISPISTGRLRGRVGGRGLSVGFVPQQRGVFEELTLRENARLIGSMIRRAAATLEDDGELLKEFGLTPYLDRPVAVLSDGMKRLSAVLCVLAAHPDILIADEPLSGIDAHNRNAILERILGNDPARVCLLSTHVELPGLRTLRIEAGKM